MTEILSCPFCGSTPKVFQQEHPAIQHVSLAWVVQCQGCTAETCSEHRQWAIDYWNRRHTHAPGEGWVMQQKFDAVERQYNELIYAVARKYKDESRHATALRYIREREEQAAQSGSDKAAAPQAEGK